MNNIKRLFPGLLFVLTAVAGCLPAGPDYVSPAVVMPRQWQAEPGSCPVVVVNCPDDLSQWWRVLDDPILTNLIEQAVTGSPDIKKARSRIRQARAQRGLTQSGSWPTAQADGSAASSQSSNNTGSGNSSQIFNLGFDASWEIDIFGGKARSVEASQADLEARREEFRDALVTLTAEVALNYVEVRTLQKRLAVAGKNLASQTETHELADFRFQAGLTTELDLQQANYTLESTRSQIPAIITSLQEAQNRLAVLLGQAPGAVHADLARERPVPTAPLEITIGVPADLLRRRPDVRQAERELAAQSARVGEAMAERYPKLTLSGSIGLEALTAGSLFNLHNRKHNLNTGFSWPVFDAGAIRKNIEIQSALQEQALIDYESVILTALEETENAITAFAQEQIKRESLAKAVEAAQTAFDLASNQYASGLTDFQEVLEAQRSLLNLQDQLATSDGEVTSNLIRLYKTLGGGWTSLAGADFTL